MRAVFTKGTPNVQGAAHGTQLQFFLSGIYLIPFYLLKIVNPYALKTPFSDLEMQSKMFEVLRLNTLLFGTATIVVLAVIAKKYLKIHPALPVFLFVSTPAWLQFSNYFKYDIALMFWLLLSLFLVFRYFEVPTIKNFIFLVFTTACALGTKISAFPLIPLLVVAFFFAERKQYQWKRLFIGLFVFFVSFLILGVPDLLLGTGNYSEFLYANLVKDPSASGNYIFHTQELVHAYVFLYSASFGHVLWVLFIAVLFFAIFKFFRKKFRRQNKKLLFLFISFFLFFISLAPLKLYLTGNRLLVILPYIVLLTSFFVQYVYVSVKKEKKNLLVAFFVCVFLLQLFEAFIWMSIKWTQDIRVTSSKWIMSHIQKNQTIGVENIPIYQMLPDVLLSDFYKKQYNVSGALYDPVVVDYKTKQLPKTIVITNADIVGYLKKSEKRLLLDRLAKEGYKERMLFIPNFSVYKHIGSTIDFYILLIIPAPTSIKIYEKT